MRRFLLAAALLAAGPALRAEELQVIASGKDAGTLDAYRIGRSYFLNAKKAGELYGARVYWYPVAGRVQMSVRGQQIRFLIKSDEAQVALKTVRMANAVIARTGMAFIPVDFFLSEAFSDAVSMDSQFNPQTRLLTVDKRSTLGGLRWFSYEDHTRVVVEFHKSLGFLVSKRGRGGFDVFFPRATADSEEDEDIGDGVVERLALRQEPKAARLAVTLRSGAGPWETKVFPDPNRLVIDVFKSPEARRLAMSRGETQKAPEPRKTPGAAYPAPAGGEREVSSAPVGVPPVEVAEVSSAPEIARGPDTGTLASVADPAGPPRHRIVVDAGHGGRDSGAVGRRGTLEKTLNLVAAKELARLLREEGAFEVLLTRDDDTFVPLADRSRMANEFNADLFISLHCNSASRKAENGYEIYFLSERASDPDAERVAEMENAALELEGKSARDEEEAARLLHAMAKTEFMNDGSVLGGLMARHVSRRVHLGNRGVKQAAFYVLRGTNAPAVLVEMGFISNAADEAKLESRKFRRKLVEGLYGGILEYAQRQNWRVDKP